MGTKQRKNRFSPVKGALISQLPMGWEGSGSGKALGIASVILALAAFQEGMTDPRTYTMLLDLQLTPAQAQGRISPYKTSSVCF